jgi:hypothetical protein
MNTETENKPVDLNRRRLAKTGLAAPIVLATLASKNALADPTYRCTISGQLSNNFSPAGHGSATDPCLFNLTPSSLKTSGGWGALEKTTVFNTYFRNAFYVRDFNNGTKKLVTNNDYPAATLEQVINLDPNFTDNSNAMERLALGRWCIVGIINALTHGTSYPLNEATIKKMFRDSYGNSSNYKHGTDIYMNRVELVSYFRFLGGELTAPVIDKAA